MAKKDNAEKEKKKQEKEAAKEKKKQEKEAKKQEKEAKKKEKKAKKGEEKEVAETEEASTEGEESTEEEEEEKKGGINILFIILPLVVLLVAGSGTAAFFILRSRSRTPAALQEFGPYLLEQRAYGPYLGDYISVEGDYIVDESGYISEYQGENLNGERYTPEIPENTDYNIGGEEYNPSGAENTPNPQNKPITIDGKEVFGPTPPPSSSAQSEQAGQDNPSQSSNPLNVSRTMTTAETVDFVKTLSPSLLGLSGESMTNYEVLAMDNLIPVDGVMCSEFMVYEDGRAGTNDIRGHYLITRSGRTKIFFLDEQTNTVTEIPLS